MTLCVVVGQIALNNLIKMCTVLLIIMGVHNSYLCMYITVFTSPLGLRPLFSCKSNNCYIFGTIPFDEDWFFICTRASALESKGFFLCAVQVSVGVGVWETLGVVVSIEMERMD